MTKVLLRYLLGAGAAVIPAAALVAYLALGREVAFGVFIGALLALLDGAGLVYLVGKLLDPGAKSSKGFLLVILLGKFVFAGVALWAVLTIFNVSGLGVVLGVAVALATLVISLNWGSSSEDGKRAMAEAEARIAQELGDKDAESG